MQNNVPILKMHRRSKWMMSDGHQATTFTVWWIRWIHDIYVPHLMRKILSYDLRKIMFFIPVVVVSPVCDDIQIWKCNTFKSEWRNSSCELEIQWFIILELYIITIWIKSLTFLISWMTCLRARFSSTVSPFTRCGGCAVIDLGFSCCTSWRRVRPRDANTSDGISKFFVSFIGFTGCCITWYRITKHGHHHSPPSRLL